MTFVLTVAQRKGGAGKTTLACQLAAAFIDRGLSVAGLDLDEQQSFTAWASARSARRGHETLFLGVGDDRHSLSFRLRRTGADISIIDTAPVMDVTVRRAIKAADLVLTPLQLSPIDLAASLPTAQAIGEAQVDALFVVNRAPARAGRRYNSHADEKTKLANCQC